MRKKGGEINVKKENDFSGEMSRKRENDKWISGLDRTPSPLKIYRMREI